MKLIISTLALGLLGWIGQPRVETKAPAKSWFTVMATNDYWLDWTNLPKILPSDWVPHYSLAVTEIERGGLYFPLIVQLRTYAKTNVEPEYFEISDATGGLARVHPATTNLVTVHILGYFDGTNAVELIEVEKPQTK